MTTLWKFYHSIFYNLDELEVFLLSPNLASGGPRRMGIRDEHQTEYNEDEHKSAKWEEPIVIVRMHRFY